MLTAATIVSLSLLLSQLHTVETLDGQTLTGRLQQISTDQVTVLPAEQPMVIEAANLRRIRGQEAAPAAPDRAIWIECKDGTVLSTSQITMNSDQAALQRTAATTWNVPRTAIRKIRYSQAQADLDRQWREIESGKRVGDVLVIRRPGDILDYVEGLVGEIKSESIAFQFEGDWIDVKLPKIDGVILYDAQPPTYPAARCRLKTLSGDVIQAASFASNDSRLEIATNAGMKLSLDIADVFEFDFGSSAIDYLSDLEPEASQWVPYLRIGAVSDELQQLYLPRRDRSFTGDPLKLSTGERGVSQEYKKGLAIQSRTTLTYRLNGQYRQFSAVAGMDTASGAGGQITLVVETDGQPRLNLEIASTDVPTPIDLDVSGTNRLTIIVDYGQNADIADHLILCDARLAK